VAAAAIATSTKPAVARRRRVGVIHDQPRVASHARAPVAAAPALAAVTMHCAHMAGSIAHAGFTTW
jgi:hypothetical protein